MNADTAIAVSAWSPSLALLANVAMATCIVYLVALVWQQRGQLPTAREAHDADRLLKRRLRHSRMNLVLRRLDMSLGRYLGAAPPSFIASQLHTCSTCEVQSQCRKALAAGRRADVTLTFCPNRFSIQLLARRAADNHL